MQRSDKPLRIESGFHEDAAELYNFFHDLESEAYAERFEEEIEDALDLIEAYPEQYGFLEEPFRRLRLKMPALIAFEVCEDEVIVLAVAHKNSDLETLLDLARERRRARPEDQEEA